jgi:hypothetical protein
VLEPDDGAQCYFEESQRTGRYRPLSQVEFNRSVAWYQSTKYVFADIQIKHYLLDASRMTRDKD